MKSEFFIQRTRINAPVETVFSWHSQEGAIQRLTPPWAPLKMIYRKGRGVEKGVKVGFKIKIFNIPMFWHAEHTEYEKNKYFKDCQVSGPFARWVHTHRFIQEPDGATTMEDHIEFRLPFGLLGRLFLNHARKDFARMFTYRHQILKHDLENISGRTEKKRVLISGASGTIGASLVPFLQTCGHEVIQLVRHTQDLAENQVFWDPYKGILDLDAVGPVDAVINLNGVDISRGRWSKKQKTLIMDSRMIPTRFLAAMTREMKTRPDVFISASAIGYYGDQADHPLTEAAPKGDCFISHVCDEWEKASLDAIDAGIRTVQLRIGVVLTPAGGALERMMPAFRSGCGVQLSHGRQYMSWISMEDTLSGILHIINQPGISGPVNLTAPHPVDNRTFSKALASVFSKNVNFVMPEFVTRLLWGQMGVETLLASARVMPSKLLDTGFVFQHERLPDALGAMLGHSQTAD